MSYFPWTEFALSNDRSSYSEEDYNSNTIIPLSTFEEYLKHVKDTAGILIVRIRHSKNELPSPSLFTRVFLYKSHPEPQIQNILTIKNDIIDSFDCGEENSEIILKDLCKRSLIKNEKLFYFVG